MHDSKVNYSGGCRRGFGGVYNIGSAGTGRTHSKHHVPKGYGEGLYRSQGLAARRAKTHLYLQLILISLVAMLIAGCGTSAGNKPLEERNEELMCPTGQLKVCPGSVGTASRLKKDQGACFCRPTT